MLPEDGESHCAASDQEDAQSEDTYGDTTLAKSESSHSLSSNHSAPGLDIIYREPSWQTLGEKPKLGQQQLIPVLRSKNKNRKLPSATREKIALYSKLPNEGQENDATGRDNGQKPPQSAPLPAFGPKNPGRQLNVQDRPKAQLQNRARALETLSTQEQNAILLSKKVYKPSTATSPNTDLAVSMNRWRESRQRPAPKLSTRNSETQTKRTACNVQTKPETKKTSTVRPRDGNKPANTACRFSTPGNRAGSPPEKITTTTKIPKVANQKPSYLPEKKSESQRSVTPKFPSSIPASTGCSGRSKSPQPLSLSLDINSSSRANSRPSAVREIQGNPTEVLSGTSEPDARRRTIRREAKAITNPRRDESPSEDGDNLRNSLATSKRRTNRVRRSVIELQESKRLVSSSSFLLKDTSSRASTHGFPSQCSSRKPSRTTSVASSVSTSISRTSRPPTRTTMRVPDASKRTPNGGQGNHSRQISLTYKSPAGAAMNVPRTTPCRNKESDTRALTTPVRESRRTRGTGHEIEDMRLSGVTAVDGAQTYNGSSALPTPSEYEQDQAEPGLAREDNKVSSNQQGAITEDTQPTRKSPQPSKRRPKAHSSPPPFQGPRDMAPMDFSQLISSAFMGGNAHMAAIGQMAGQMGYMPVLAFVDPRMCYPMTSLGIFQPTPMICPCNSGKPSISHTSKGASRHGNDNSELRAKESKAPNSDKTQVRAEPTDAFEKPLASLAQTPLPKIALLKGTPLTTDALAQSESVRAALNFMGIGPKDSQHGSGGVGRSMAVDVDEESEYLKSPSEGRSKLPVANKKVIRPQPLTLDKDLPAIKPIGKAPESPLRIKASLTSSAIAAKIAALQDSTPTAESENLLTQSATQAIADPDRSFRSKPLASRSMSRLQALTDGRRKHGAVARARVVPKLPADQANFGARTRDLRKQATDSARRVRHRLANIIHTNNAGGKFMTMQADGLPRRVDSLANAHIRDRLPTFTVEELKFLSSI